VIRWILVGISVLASIGSLTVNSLLLYRVQQQQHWRPDQPSVLIWDGQKMHMLIPPKDFFVNASSYKLEVIR
jgi:hypothetical protein